jgi:23S rRNA pseudouridine1911/1915/1917 synthase
MIEDLTEEISGSEEKDELYEHFNFEVDRGQSLTRMDKYLLGLIPNTSRN